MVKSAFDKIAAGINDAIAFADGYGSRARTPTLDLCAMQAALIGDTENRPLEPRDILQSLEPGGSPSCDRVRLKDPSTGIDVERS